MAKIAFPPESFVRFLLYLAGILSTVVGSWVASKIHAYHDNRRMHHDDLKQKVVVPLLQGLRSRYAPLVSHACDMVRIQHGQLRQNVDAKVTEDAQVYGSSIQAIDPAAAVEGTLDMGLLEDARQNHYKKLIEDWETFRTGWTEYARKCEEWVVAMATRILHDSGLPSLRLPQGGPYVMEYSLAIFLYLRLFSRPSSTLRKVKEGEAWVLYSVGQVASGDEEQIDELVRLLDSLVETEQAVVKGLLNQSRSFQERLRALSRKLSLASVERSLRGRCSMVKCFR
jgi:hypothetical protein